MSFVAVSAVYLVGDQYQSFQLQNFHQIVSIHSVDSLLGVDQQVEYPTIESLKSDHPILQLATWEVDSVSVESYSWCFSKYHLAS